MVFKNGLRLFVYGAEKTEFSMTFSGGSGSHCNSWVKRLIWTVFCLILGCNCSWFGHLRVIFIVAALEWVFSLPGMSSQVVEFWSPCVGVRCSTVEVFGRHGYFGIFCLIFFWSIWLLWHDFLPIIFQFIVKGALRGVTVPAFPSCGSALDRWLVHPRQWELEAVWLSYQQELPCKVHAFDGWSWIFGMRREMLLVQCT